MPSEASSSKAAAVARRREAVLKSMRPVKISKELSSQATVLLHPRRGATSVLLRSSFSIDHVSSNIPRSPVRIHTGKCV